MIKKLFNRTEQDDIDAIIFQKDKLIEDERRKRFKAEQEIEDLTKEIQRLQMIIDTPKVHNERNAGRKTRFTYKERSIVEIMYYGNKGVSAIIKALEQETGEKWSRSTINYFIQTYLQNHK